MYKRYFIRKNIPPLIVEYLQYKPLMNYEGKNKKNI